jgi:hypothetical protein
MNFDVRIKPVISFLLMCLITCNTLLSATGGVLLFFHHDMSFHVDADAADVETDEHALHSMETSDHSHHHHELELTAEVDPTLRGNTFDRVQAPALGAAMSLFDSTIAQPVRHMKGGSSIRPPPEAMPSYLSPLRTQVLRL